VTMWLVVAVECHRNAPPLPLSLPVTTMVNHHEAAQPFAAEVDVSW
jgi:hypothetical protein